MSRIWFTSDIHFGHRRILTYCPNRPFTTIEEHDAAIMTEWREKVAPHDVIYFLGDLTLDSDPLRVAQLCSKLTGTIHVVLGNHDRGLKRVRAMYDQFADLDIPHDLIAEVKGLTKHVVFLPRSDRVEGFYRFRMGGISCVLNHHPVEDWPGRAQHGHDMAHVDPLSGRWHLHGHSHGLSRRMPARLDVGWDTANKILSWEEVQSLVRANM